MWFLYVFHWLLLACGLCYALVAFGVISLGADLDAGIVRRPLKDHLITVAWIGGSYLAAHYLFFRRRGALLLYALSAGVYLGPNLARYLHACWDNRCPGSEYLVSVGYTFIFFVVVWLLFLIAQRSWSLKQVTA